MFSCVYSIPIITPIIKIKNEQPAITKMLSSEVFPNELFTVAKFNPKPAYNMSKLSYNLASLRREARSLQKTGIKLANTVKNIHPNITLCFLQKVTKLIEDRIFR